MCLYTYSVIFFIEIRETGLLFGKSGFRVDNLSIGRYNNAIQIDGIQTGKLISIYTDQGILSRQISAEHETTVLSIEGFPHGIYFISIEGYGPTFKIAL